MIASIAMRSLYLISAGCGILKTRLSHRWMRSKKVIKTLPKEVVRLGGMTDCYQPIERELRNTRHTIELLNQYKVPYLIVTKSALILDDIDILDKNLAHIQITITTTDDELSKTYENASVPSERIHAVEVLQENGFDVCDKIVVEFLRVNPFIKKWFNIDYSRYKAKRNGYWHLPLKDKKKLLEGLDFAEMSVCEDESMAYVYWKYHFNHNPDDCCNLRRSNNADNGEEA